LRPFLKEKKRKKEKKKRKKKKTDCADAEIARFQKRICAEQEGNAGEDND